MSVQRQCHAISRPLRAHIVWCLYVHPKLIHILESCPRNVYDLARSILQPHCLEHSSASKSHSIPVQGLLSVAAGSDGAWSPTVQVFAHPASPSQQEWHMGRLCRLLDNGCVDLLWFGHEELITVLHGDPSLLLLLRLFWGIGDLETWRDGTQS